MSFGFFDTCSRHPNSGNDEFVLAEKMWPVRKAVKHILDTADRLGAPVLSTTCLGTLRGSPGMCAATTCAAMSAAGTSASAKFPDGTAFVAMNATPDEVSAALRHRQIIIERQSCKTADDNVRLRTFDVFGVNKNAAKIVRSLGNRHWLVFGGGFEHCLVAAVEGLRALDLRVTVLEDGCVHGGRSIPATFLRTFERIKSLGAGWARLDAVCPAHFLDRDACTRASSLPDIDGEASDLGLGAALPA